MIPVVVGYSQLKVTRLLPEVVTGGAVSVGVLLVVEKAKGDDCGLSVPSIKIAVNVKLVVAAVKLT